VEGHKGVKDNRREKDHRKKCGMGHDGGDVM